MLGNKRSSASGTSASGNKRVRVLSTYPPMQADVASTMLMTPHTVLKFDPLVRKVLTENVFDEPPHKTSTLLISSNEKDGNRETKHYNSKEELFVKTKIREIGTVLLIYLFHIDHPSSASSSIIPKVHFLQWLQTETTLPDTTKIFDTSTSVQQSNNTVHSNPAGPAANLTIRDLEKMLASLANVTDNANITVHGLLVGDVVRVFESSYLTASMPSQIFRSLKSLIEAILESPLHQITHADFDKNFKKLVKKFRIRVASAPTLNTIERVWSQAFDKAECNYFTKKMIDRGLVVSSKDHADLRVEHADLRVEHADLRVEHTELKTNHGKTEKNLTKVEQKLAKVLSHLNMEDDSDDE